MSPITGELVAIADMAEHMRISLIDPRWKEQREAMLAKIRCASAWPKDQALYLRLPACCLTILGLRVQGQHAGDR